MSYGLLLVDADETLFDFHASELLAIAETFERFDIPNTEELSLAYREANAAQWRKLERGETTQARLRVARFEDFLALVGLKRDAQAMSDCFVSRLATHGIALEGAEEFCKRISASIPMIIVTNGISEVQRGRFERSPLRRYISGMVVSGELGVTKPDPRMAEAALELAGFSDRSAAIFMGDSLTADIPCARAAGLDSLLYTMGAEPPEGHGATYVAKTYDEAAGIILRSGE